MRLPLRWAFGSLLAVLPSGCASFDSGAADEGGFIAHRAAFGSDTATANQGTFELEFGTTVDPEADTLQVPLAVRYGSDERTEVFACLLPYQLEGQPGRDSDGLGDTVLGIRQRFHDHGDGPSAAYQFQVKLPTGDESEGRSSGEVDYIGSAILTQDHDNAATTFYYELGVIDDPDDNRELQHALAVISEVTLGRTWGAFGQVVSTLAPEQDTEALSFGFGVSVQVAEGLAWDVGASVGLNDDAPDLELYFGFTWAVGQPMDHRH